MTPDFPPLYILRHGETEWNRLGRMQGRLDSPLTDLGRMQAAAQADILTRAGITAQSHQFAVSPQGRAIATAEIALAPIDVRASTDPRLCEIDMGDWQGLTLDEIDARAPGLFETFPGLEWYDHLPGGETLADVRARAASFLADLTGPAVIITHGVLSAAMRAHVLGLPHDAIASMPGGQGVIYHLEAGRMIRLEKSIPGLVTPQNSG